MPTTKTMKRERDSKFLKLQLRKYFDYFCTLATLQSALEHIFKINIIVVKLSANLSQMIRTARSEEEEVGRKGGW